MRTFAWRRRTTKYALLNGSLGNDIRLGFRRLNVSFCLSSGIRLNSRIPWVHYNLCCLHCYHLRWNNIIKLFGFYFKLAICVSDYWKVPHIEFWLKSDMNFWFSNQEILHLPCELKIWIRARSGDILWDNNLNDNLSPRTTNSWKVLIDMK